MSNTAGDKDTIYVDVDDEITSIIEKVRTADGKVVALVLPKRATVLQSIVNMKLLKRTAEDIKKHLVLVTTEASLMPLAGNVGLHVASTPTSKPVIPSAPEGLDDATEDIDEPLDMGSDEAADTFDASAAATTAVGDLAGGAATSKLAPSDIDEDLVLDDDTPAKDVAAKKPAGNKKLRVPNFDSFRKRLLLGVGIFVLLIVGWILAFVVLPHATVTIHTETSTITSNLNLNLDTAATKINADHTVVPAIAQTTQKSYNQQVPASGQKNTGATATGTVTFSGGTCSANFPADVPAGTGVSTSGQTYITQQAASFSAGNSHGQCVFQTGSVPITAQAGGTLYNTSGNASFTVSGRSSVSGSGSASGGTDSIVKIVAQSDIDSATAKINAQDTSSVKTDLQSSLKGKAEEPITSTFVAGTPQITSSANAGDPADTVTVTEIITYTMLGVKQADLKTVVDANVTGQLDKGKQSILDDGVAHAIFSEQSPASATNAVIAIHAKSVAGPQLDTTALKAKIVGKKSGDIQSLIKETPGVTNVDVHYSPFWVSATPSSASKITVQVDKSNTAKQ